MILRDSRLTRHPSCLTSGVHLSPELVPVNRALPVFLGLAG